MAEKKDISKENTVHEAKFVVTIMGQASSLDEFDDSITNRSLINILKEMDNGELIGQCALVFSETLPADQVGARLHDLANDGAFFNLDDEEGDFDPDAPKADAAGRILRAQITQGLSSAGLEACAREFIEKIGFSDSFATFLESKGKLAPAPEMGAEPE